MTWQTCCAWRSRRKRFVDFAVTIVVDSVGILRLALAEGTRKFTCDALKQTFGTWTRLVSLAPATPFRVSLIDASIAVVIFAITTLQTTFDTRIAIISNAVLIKVSLVWIGLFGTIIAGISDPIAIAVGLIGVRNTGAVVPGTQTPSMSSSLQASPKPTGYCNRWRDSGARFKWAVSNFSDKVTS